MGGLLYLDELKRVDKLKELGGQEIVPEETNSSYQWSLWYLLSCVPRHLTCDPSSPLWSSKSSFVANLSLYSKKCFIGGGEATNWIKWDISLPAGGNRGNCVSGKIKLVLLYKPEMGIFRTWLGPNFTSFCLTLAFYELELFKPKYCIQIYNLFLTELLLHSDFWMAPPLRVWCF